MNKAPPTNEDAGVAPGVVAESEKQASQQTTATPADAQAPVKRGRGRPKGSKNKPTANTASSVDTQELVAHPLAGLIPEMPADELVDLERDVQAHGQRQPIILFEGQILDGRHRYAICRKLQITPNTEVFTGTSAEAEALVLSLNVHRRHLTRDQKHKIIAQELQRDPVQSDRAIAEKVKASPTTVGKVRAAAEAAGDVSKVDTRKDTKGRKQPATKPPKPIKVKIEKPAHAEPVTVNALAARVHDLIERGLRDTADPALLGYTDELLREADEHLQVRSGRAWWQARETKGGGDAPA